RGRWAPQTPCPLALAGESRVRPRRAAPRALRAPARRRLFPRKQARSWPREQRESQPRDLAGVNPLGGRALVHLLEAPIGVFSPASRHVLSISLWTLPRKPRTDEAASRCTKDRTRPCTRRGTGVSGAIVCVRRTRVPFSAVRSRTIVPRTSVLSPST